MAVQPISDLTINVNPEQVALFLPLIEKGASIQTRLPCSLRELLCDRLGIDETYAEQRVQTIFHNGKAVDDMDAMAIRDGDRIALSAAMPGLVGATFRKGGQLAGFRHAISQHGETGDGDLEAHNQGRLTLKLFNLILKELGPLLLHDGAWVASQDLRTLVTHHRKALESGFQAETPGQAPLALADVLTAERFAEELLLRLTMPDT